MDSPDRQPPVPATLYIIASTMRTGSYLLCEGLDATGVAGHPQEIFCAERRKDYCGRWHLPANIPLSRYVQAAVKKCTTANGICGMKIHWHHVEPLANLRGGVGKPWRILPRLFPNAKYIHLQRRDRRAQAISWFRAKATNEWWRIAGVTDPDVIDREPQLDLAEIHRMEIELEQHDRGWQDFFATGSVPVMKMEYETLASDYRGEVGRVLTFLGQDPVAADRIPAPRLIRQSDSMTAEWRRLMDAEYPTGNQGDK